MASPLDLFTFYNNRSLGGVTDPNSDQARAALAQVQQYDPGASYRQTFGSDGQLIGYTLDYDASKLPGVNGATSLGGTSGHGSGADYMPRFSTVQPNMQLNDPNAVTQDPNYGKITDNTNIGTPRSLLDTLGPAAVGAFGFLMGGMPALYQGVFGQGAYGAGAAADAGAGAASAAADPGFGGGMGGAANEMGATSSSIGAAGAAANPASIATSNWLVAHGLPSQLGLSSGALGAAMSEPGFGLGGLGNVASTLSRVGGLLTGGKPVTGGALSGGGGGGLLGAGQTGDDATDIIRRFYGEDALSKLKKKASNG